MPAGVAITREDYTAAELRRAAARTDDANAARRMLALAQVMDGKTRGEAAACCGMDRQTLRDWVHRYNAGIGWTVRSICSRSETPAIARAGTGGGRAGAARAKFGRAWRGALAAGRPRPHDRAALRRHPGRTLGRRAAASPRVPANIGAAAGSPAGCRDPSGA